eukprot:Gregarina_sp_Poly_1__8324@NODE_486_length_7989_cov_344_940798_g389_i1_p1_GENE_NODE_486_length_7989_cov_344_940798_g389_i1NODE_486_length_7989_cov_344_940798_g389_i1_p1_ORF_typecomplete_len530_score73_56Cyclin/PF08613_11/2_5e23Cyclin_N/PF00134_23/3_8e07_NODE_486_length_7989_cov_344_940798_g389_i11531742
MEKTAAGAALVRPGIASQGSTCSVSTAAGSASSGSGCQLSPSMGLSSRGHSSKHSADMQAESLSPSSTTPATCKASSAGSTIEAQSPAEAEGVSSTSVSSSPGTQSDTGEDLLLAYAPVRRGPVATTCRKSLPVSHTARQPAAAPLSARSECPRLLAALKDQTATASEAFADVGMDAISSAHPFKALRPSSMARARYNHLENALVFVAMASKLITTNAVCAEQQPYSVFRSEPGDPVWWQQLKQLAERLSESMRCKYPCYVLALIYLDQVSKKCASNISISSDTFQRLVVAAVVVAAKFYDDLYFSNEHYSKELGFPLEVVNTLEVCFLVLLDFNLRVSQCDFKAVLRAFDEVRQDCCLSEGSSVWCGLNMIPLPSDVVSVVAAEYRVSSAAGAHVTFPRPHPRCGEIDHYLASREVRGHRFESEEEFLFKTALLGRCKVVHKLIQQYHEELKKLEQEKLASFRAANKKLPLMATPGYNQGMYNNRHYLMMNPSASSAAASGTSCVMQQRSFIGWNPAVSVAGGWKRHV